MWIILVYEEKSQSSDVRFIAFVLLFIDEIKSIVVIFIRGENNVQILRKH